MADIISELLCVRHPDFASLCEEAAEEIDRLRTALTDCRNIAYAFKDYGFSTEGIIAVAGAALPATLPRRAKRRGK